MPSPDPTRTSTLAGYGFVLTTGGLWGTTGPLSTALYQQGVEVTDVGFWRVLLATVGFLLYGAIRRDLFRVDGRGPALLAVALPALGHAPEPASTFTRWTLVVGLGLGSVFATNLFFFADVRRIEAAPTAIAASIEPVVGALLALAVFGPRLTVLGWLGLILVVAGVAARYVRERAVA